MDLAEGLLSTAPLPLLGLLVFAVLIAAMQVGALVKRRMGRREGGSNSEEGYIVSGALGLMALLLGFTFNLAIDRFDHRRELALEEANAIGTTYLRAQLLEEPARTRVSTLLQRYSANHLALAEASDPRKREALLAQSDEGQIRLWRATVEALRPVRNDTISRPFLEAMNATIDAGAARVAARRAHVPPRVLATLLLYMAISAFILGCVSNGSRWRPAPSVLLALFSLAYILTIDIDRPNGGGIREPQAAIADVLAMMRAHPPGSFDPPAPSAAQPSVPPAPAQR